MDTSTDASNSQSNEGISEGRIVTQELVFSELRCGLGHNILWNPIVCSKCEAAFCEACLAGWKKLYSNDTTSCPTGCLGQQTQPPKLLMNLLKKLKIRCQHINEGCDMELPYDNLQQHERQCEFQKVLC